MSIPDYRPYVPKMGTDRHFGKTPRQFVEELSDARWQKWREKIAPLLADPFKGITTDGKVVPGLFELRDERAPTAAVLAAITTLFHRLSPEQLATIRHPLNSKARHHWVNGIPRYETFGIWLDDVTPAVRDAALDVVRASLSAAGYDTARKVMKLNAFLGELVGAPLIFGEYTYQLHTYGEPSRTEPWGWQLYGHHLCITCFIVGNQMTLTPHFMGAEPRYADQGPHAGTSLFDDEECSGLAFARSLSTAQKRKAIVHDTILPGALPPGRHQGSDGMMYGGYYRDNPIVPCEGIPGADLDQGQRRALLDLTQRYLASLPPGPLQARMADVERHLSQTRFAWSGGLADDSVFYYRIQSPVLMIEFDHHKGVILNNKEPQRFHTHTVVRTPNGNDYGLDLLRLHYETAPHHQHNSEHSTSG